MANSKFKTRKSTEVKRLADLSSGTKVIGVVNSDMVAFVWNDSEQAKLVTNEMAKVITAHAHLSSVQYAMPDREDDL